MNITETEAKTIQHLFNEVLAEYGELTGEEQDLLCRINEEIGEESGIESEEDEDEDFEEENI